MQVLELLCAVCTYSPRGHVMALDALQHLKVTHAQLYGCDLIMYELRNTGNVTYQTRLLSIINCLTLGCNNLQKRVCIRNKFLGRGLGQLISSLRAIDDKELQLQVSAFTDHQRRDEMQLQTSEQLTHLQLFETILKKIANTPQAFRFHSMLQNLAELDLTNPKADNVLESLDALSSEATCCRMNVQQSDGICETRTVPTQTEVENGREVNQHRNKEKHHQSSTPEPSMSLLSYPLPPPPPPLPALAVPLVGSTRIPSTLGVLPLGVLPPSSHAASNSEQKNQVPPPPPVPNNTTFETPMSSRISSGYLTCPTRHSLPVDLIESVSLTLVKDKCNTLPMPKRKMKTLHWTKIPGSVIGESVWTEMQIKPSNLTVDFKEVEELFCQKQADMKHPKSSLGSLLFPVNHKITLLETKRNLAVNIYLKQFKSGAKEVIEAIKNLKGVDIGAEKLRALLPLLPTEKELISVRSYSGDLECLGEAEKFYLQLSEVPSFALRIRAMLLKEDFFSRACELKEQLEAVKDACNKLMTNEHLKEFLALVLHLGNYINAGSYAGNAAGFTLSTLPKLLEIKANKPRLTFLHYVIQVAEANNEKILQFTADINNMKEMARISLEFLQEEVMKVTSEVKYVESHLKEDETGIQSQFKDFLKNALKHSTELQEATKNVKACSHALAKHFCEDPKEFQPEDCFKLFADILNMIERARLENEEIRKTEEREIKDEKKQNKATGSTCRARFSPDRKCNAIKRVLRDICSRNFKLRHN